MCVGGGGFNPRLTRGAMGTCKKRRSDMTYANVCLLLHRANPLCIYIYIYLSGRRRRWPRAARWEPVEKRNRSHTKAHDQNNTTQHTTRRTQKRGGAK